MNDKKLVTYCIFTYNQEEYVSEAIKSVFNQTYFPLEIIISDDCSTDDTFHVAEQIINEYKGEHKIILNRNKENMGIGAHLSMVYNSIATGEYLIGLGGDDLAKSNHAEYAVGKMEENFEVNLIDFNADMINQNGELLSKRELHFKLKKFSIDDYINLRSIQSFAPGRIIRRELLNSFNPISKNCPTEDSVFVFRSLLTGGFIRINKSLVFYRKHDGNTSSSIGLSKLSNHAIFSQYLKDLLHFYDNGFIDDIQFERVIKRLNFELANRKLKYSTLNKNWLSRLMEGLRVRILRYTYKLTNY